MSFSSAEDGWMDKYPVKTDPIIKKVPENLTPGRTNLRKWLSRSFRVVITDGRILVGIFNCTDKDANIVLAMCAEYLEEGGEARILGNVMIPGKHIVSIEVDLLGTQVTEGREALMLGNVMMPEKQTEVDVIEA